MVTGGSAWRIILRHALGEDWIGVTVEGGLSCGGGGEDLEVEKAKGGSRVTRTNCLVRQRGAEIMYCVTGVKQHDTTTMEHVINVWRASDIS